ncbi:MAG: DUF5674 family protein [Patescibacteria group bacterium]
MSVVIIKDILTVQDVEKAREEYKDYIKITVDIDKGVVAIGGQFHADAEMVMMQEYNCKQSSIWGGGYQISKDTFIVDALINMRPSDNNPSSDILNPEKREKFLTLAKQKLANIKSLL